MHEPVEGIRIRAQLRSCAVQILVHGIRLHGRHALRRALRRTANLPAKILDFRGFDSSRLIILSGGILMSIGSFPELSSQQLLVGIILVGRLGVSIHMHDHAATISTSLTFCSTARHCAHMLLAVCHTVSRATRNLAQCTIHHALYTALHYSGATKCAISVTVPVVCLQSSEGRLTTYRKGKPIQGSLRRRRSCTFIDVAHLAPSGHRGDTAGRHSRSGASPPAPLRRRSPAGGFCCCHLGLNWTAMGLVVQLTMPRSQRGLS